MDHVEPTAGGSAKPASELVYRPATGPRLPPDFVPLRLMLQPGRATMEVLQADVLVGRHSCADLRLPLPDVSRRHCRLVFSAGRWQVIDLNSLNGVYINDQRITQAILA